MRIPITIKYLRVDFFNLAQDALQQNVNLMFIDTRTIKQIHVMQIMNKMYPNIKWYMEIRRRFNNVAKYRILHNALNEEK